jgi:hypothetical protein
MSAVDHLLLTRFNVSVPVSRSSFNRGLDPTWLNHRLDLFERFCLPSVQAQSALNFVWLVYFDKGTPESYLPRIERYRSFPLFRPVFVSHFDVQVVRESITSHLSPHASHLVTSRLDNDDAICRSFIEEVQRQVDDSDRLIINFNRGCVWHDSRVYVYDYRSNPFLSMIERKDGVPRTIFERDHNQYGNDSSLRCLSGPPAWLQTVHGANVSNSVRGRRVSRESFLRENRFAIDPGPVGRREAAWELWLDGWRTWPLIPRLVARFVRRRKHAP